MTDSLDDRFVQLGEDQRRHRKLTADLLKMEAELQRRERRLEVLGESLHKEGRDVRKLEGLSLAALFHAVLGDRAERLDDERKEFLSVKLRYDTELQATEALDQDLASCRHELGGLGDLAQRRQSLLTERERELRDSGTDAGDRLIELAGRLADARADRRETEEAIEAGRQALAALSVASDCLGSARGWGQFDMLGGGLIATSIKHSHIDKARSAIERSQRLLDRFARELQEVGASKRSLEVEIGGFDKFADFLFDNLITDWIVQSKIVRATDGVRDTATKVREVVRQLERRRRDEVQAVQQLEVERERILTGR